MADATHISLKVKLDDDIRRFSVAKSINYAELHALISKHFVLAPESVQVKYIDDEEELITLGSDLELEEAKRLQPTVLRLNVYDSKPRRHTTDQLPTPKLEAAFVRDVTVPDGTNVGARVKFQKLWCVKNTGSTAWPKGVVLKTVDPKDDQLLAFSTGAINRALAPGEETVIGVDLQAPARPGRCVQHWRLFTEDGVAFGSRLWVDVTVGPSPQDNAAAERELAEAEEAARRQAEQAELEQRIKEMEEEEARLREEQEAEAMRRAAEEAEEAERQRLEELERILAEEEEKRRQEEEELRRQEEEDRLRMEEALRREQEEKEELRRKLEEERRMLEEEKRKMEEALRRKQEEEEHRRKMLEEEEKRKQEEEKRKHEEEKNKLLNSKYPGQLTALAEMGFTNVEHNVKLLDKHKGSLDLALEALLSGH
jgi:DNA segregation ATPase FtsK/SpoIIIE-like protein